MLMVYLMHRVWKDINNRRVANMKLSIIFGPALAALAMAGVVCLKIKETILMSNANVKCCDEFDCFLGCPIDSTFQVSFCFNDQTERRAIEKMINVFEDFNFAVDSNVSSTHPRRRLGGKRGGKLAVLGLRRRGSCIAPKCPLLINSTLIQHCFDWFNIQRCFNNSTINYSLQRINLHVDSTCAQHQFNKDSTAGFAAS